MANREQGELSLEIDGRSYTLLLNMAAMAALEEHFSTDKREVTFQDVLMRVNAGSVRHIRAFIWASLQQHHPGVTVEEAGRLIDAAGGLIAFSTKLQTLTGQTTPDARDLKDLGIDPGKRPRKAQARTNGTGARSISTRAAQA